MNDNLNSKPNYYAIIPANVRYDSRLKPNEKLLYAEITSLANKHGYCYANNQYFANLYEVTKNTVSSWVSNLKDLGYIKIKISYKSNSKEIEKRMIFINTLAKQSVNLDDPIHKKEDTLSIKKERGYHEKKGGGITKKMEDNNTSINNTSNNNIIHGGTPKEEEDYKTTIKDLWNDLPDTIPKIKTINSGTQRYRHLKARINQYSLDDVKTAINNIYSSDWLLGINSSGWVITFDWFIKPNNFIKVLEGNYINKDVKKGRKTNSFGYPRTDNDAYMAKRIKEERLKRMKSLRGDDTEEAEDLSFAEKARKKRMERQKQARKEMTYAQKAMEKRVEEINKNKTNSDEELSFAQRERIKRQEEILKKEQEEYSIIEVDR